MFQFGTVPDANLCISTRRLALAAPHFTMGDVTRRLRSCATKNSTFLLALKPATC